MCPGVGPRRDLLTRTCPPLLLNCGDSDTSVQITVSPHPDHHHEWAWPRFLLCLKFSLGKQAKVLRGFTPSPPRPPWSGPATEALNPFLLISGKGHLPLAGFRPSPVLRPAVNAAILGLCQPQVMVSRSFTCSTDRGDWKDSGYSLVACGTQD